MLALYNVVFTPFVPLLIGITDQFMSARYLISNPSLYYLGQSSAFLNDGSFWRAFMNGIVQSALGFLVVTAIMGNDGVVFSNGTVGGIYGFSVTLYGSLLVTVLLKAALVINSWTWLCFVVLVASLLSWFAYLLWYDFLSRLLGHPQFLHELVGITQHLLRQASFWLIMVLVPAVCLVADFSWKAWNRIERPREVHIVQEMQMIELRERKNQKPLV